MCAVQHPACGQHHRVREHEVSVHEVIPNGYPENGRRANAKFRGLPILVIWGVLFEVIS